MTSPKRWLQAAILASLMGLAACGGTTTLIKTQIVPVEPPSELYNGCPDAPPALTGSYTQKDVAVLLNQLYETHAQCKSTIAGIRDYVAKEKALIERLQPSADQSRTPSYQ